MRRLYKRMQHQSMQIRKYWMYIEIYKIGWNDNIIVNHIQQQL